MEESRHNHSMQSKNPYKSVMLTISKITRAFLFVIVCFFLNTTTLSGQGWGLSDSTIQVMKEQYNTTDNDTLRLQSAWGLSLYYVTSQIDSARQYFQASYEASTDLNYPLGMAGSSSLVGYMYYLLGDYKSAYQWINISKSHIDQIEENNEDPIFHLLNIGNIWANLIEVTHGLRSQIEQITGQIYYSVGMYEEALVHQQLNVGHLEKTTNIGFLGRAQWNVGTIYLSMDELEKAEDYLLEANKNIDDNDTYKGSALVDLASLERLKGNHSLSLEYIQESFHFNKKNSNYSGIADGHHALGRYYYDQGDYDKSIAEYITADEIDKKINPNYKGYNSMLGRAKCYKAKGELAKAFALNTEGQRLKAESEAERKKSAHAFHRYILEQKDELQEEHIEVEKI